MNRIARAMHSPDLGLLLIRLMLGVIGVYHGSGKLFGLFGGPGIKGFADILAGMKVPVPLVSAVCAGSAEFFGGLAIALGLFTRIGAVFFAFTMAVAIALVHPDKFSGEGGMEFPLTLAVVAVALIFTGPGRYSIANAFARPEKPLP